MSNLIQSQQVQLKPRTDSIGEIVRPAFEQSPGVYDYLNECAKKLGIDVVIPDHFGVPSGVENPDEETNSEPEYDGFGQADNCYKYTNNK